MEQEEKKGFMDVMFNPHNKRIYTAIGVSLTGALITIILGAASVSLAFAAIVFYINYYGMLLTMKKDVMKIKVEDESNENVNKPKTEEEPKEPIKNIVL